MALGLFHFHLLYDVLESLHFIYDEEELALTVLKKISEALNSEGGTIFKLQSGGVLYPLASYGVSVDKLRELDFKKGEGVVGWVVEHKQPVKVDQPRQDQRFIGMIDALTGFSTKSILAAPILARGEIVGVIEFMNRRDGAFTIPELELVSAVGREVGIAFQNVHLIRDLGQTKAFLDAMADSLPTGILVVNEEGGVVKLNPFGRKIFHLEEKKGAAEPFPSFSDVFKGYDPFLNVIRTAMKAAAPVVRQEVRLPIQGKEAVVGYSAVPVTDPKKTRLGTAVLFQDITKYLAKK